MGLIEERNELQKSLQKQQEQMNDQWRMFQAERQSLKQMLLGMTEELKELETTAILTEEGGAKEVYK